MNNKLIAETRSIYSDKKKEIKSRLDEFSGIWKNGNDEDIFIELIFCLFTPQSKAKTCWACVENITKKKLHLADNPVKIAGNISGVRFHNKKAVYAVEARKKFEINGKLSIKSKIKSFSDVFNSREWLTENIKGFGYKEASHFLRNIGFGKNIAILDRHILKNLRLMKVIKNIPDHLTKSDYLEIEGKMRVFAEKLDIPMDYLDFILWYKETGEFFK